MPIIVQRRLPEVGRIRIGMKGDRGEPKRLKTFRLTSQDKAVLDKAALVYKGVVKPWNDQWELVTQVNELPIMISPDPPPSLHYELWAQGGCKRRCDTETCTIPGEPQSVQVPCMCNAKDRECKLVMRVAFMLPDVPGLGVWRLDTQSKNAAAEMPGCIDLLLAARANNRFPEAVLAIETRKFSRLKADGTSEKKVFPVVTIRIREDLRQILGIPAPAITATTEAKQIEDATPSTGTLL